MTYQSRNVRPIEYVACYAIWIGLCALAGLIVQYSLGVILDISMAIRANQWVAQAMRQLSLPILGLAWLILIFWLEHYLRTGLPRQQTWRRALKVGLVLVGIIAVIFGLHQVL